jgi:predicted ATPase
VAEQNERYFEAELLRMRGEVMLAQDAANETASIECFERSLATARRQQTRAWELRTAMSLGRLLARRGRAAEAAAILRPVTDWFQEGLATADLREARELLAAWEP